MEKDIPYKWKPKRVRAAILTSDKTDFQSLSVIRDKKRQHIVIKGSIHQEATTNIHTYNPVLEYLSI